MSSRRSRRKERGIYRAKNSRAGLWEYTLTWKGIGSDATRRTYHCANVCGYFVYLVERCVNVDDADVHKGAYVIKG